MNKIRNKKVRSAVRVDAGVYVNTETGETLASEGMAVFGREDTGMVELSYGEFATIDTVSWRWVCGELSDSDMGKLSKMVQMTHTTWNILYNGNNIPHSSVSLMNALEVRSDGTFYSFVNRLIDLGVLYVIRKPKDGAAKQIYILNPYLSRKRRNIAEKCAKMFKQLGRE